MGIPAGNVRCLKAGHILVANDKVLQRLIQRRAEVDIAVCIRRAVVQNIKRLTVVLFENGLVNLVFIPLFEHYRLALR